MRRVHKLKVEVRVLAKQRGRATLPNPELIADECQFLIERLSRQEQSSFSESLEVGKGGLPPLLG